MGNALKDFQLREDCEQLELFAVGVGSDEHVDAYGEDVE
jgi:hypothetical protein